ncbi:hypothetical protein POJ06DRAFT_240620 [Lipomyces tetrasporus]|uniref:Uncharacterized protein n=1 Tax=Lipomyces tetrasporus TaxID=54092 RepID=A0AAD7QL64_9ASCO|nr:uncharacterized protein POJ06DRAFT_240620 [Lipomyces tetrasporus]KAJ8097291.1 hypothetical protein POJ06DRAFT_240620 [Lipomyces tetrasporus]
MAQRAADRRALRRKCGWSNLHRPGPAALHIHNNPTRLLSRFICACSPARLVVDDGPADIVLAVVPAAVRCVASSRQIEIHAPIIIFDKVAASHTVAAKRVACTRRQPPHDNSSSSSSSKRAEKTANDRPPTVVGNVAYTGAAHQFPLPDPLSRPGADMVDTFAEFANRRQCKVSALEIHRPFEPLCQTKDDVLRAMSGGGRIGFDAPYMPRDCDMRWYDRTEICQIMGRFDKILFVGDSMMRHIVGALHILLREDLGYGAVTAWNFRQDERDACFCNGQFDTLRCGVQGIFNSDDVAKFDAGSLKCDAKSINVQNHVMPNYPPTAAELANLGDVFAHYPAPDGQQQQQHQKPVAIVYGHGHHNDLDIQATAGWLTSIQRTISERMSKAVRRAQLFVTPGAAGPSMFDLDVLKHGHKALALFETGMADVCRGKEIDLLGTYNATTQTTIRDGKHSDIRGNLLKIMMVLNWLDKTRSRPGRRRPRAGPAAGSDQPAVDA